MDAHFKETFFPDWQQSFEVQNVVYEGRSKYQKIDIFDTKRFGRVLALDNTIQCTESDEFAYHEMFAHVPLNAYGDARSVLIIGGGDGGLLREVLKHNSIRQITLVEIDEEVIKLSKTFLPSICKDAFDDSRVNIVIADAAQWVATATDKFDVVLVDRTDEIIGPAAELYTRQFYINCSKLMTPEGIFVAQIGGLYVNTTYLEHQLLTVSQAWKKSSIYLFSVPTYIGGSMTLLWAANWNITTVNDADLQTIPNLRYYNTKIHKAAFALPTFAAEL